jgi:uncharacterized protein YecT (DUF1311 family)
MNFLTISFCALILANSTNLLAQKNDPCKSQKTTIEMNDCAKQELAKDDKQLNLAYQNLLKKLAPSDKLDDTDYTEVKK